MSAIDVSWDTRTRGVSAPASDARTPVPLALAATALLLALAAAVALRPGAPPPPVGPAAHPAAPAALPALFVPNAGQAAPGVRFAAHGASGAMLFRDREVVLGADGTRMRFAAANPHPTLTGTRRRAGVVNYVRGDRASWRTDLPMYAAVVYRGLYPGVELRFSGRTMTWTVAPGADAERVAWDHPGAAVRLRAGDGALEISASGALTARTHIQGPPVAWQMVHGRRVPVDARYRVDDRGRVGFSLGRHRPGAAVAIGIAAAPAARASAAATALGTSTLLGGLQWDEAMDVETDAAGATYVAGFSEAPGAGTAGALQRTHRGLMDAYVAKISPDGRSLRYATFLGGRDLDVANGLAIDREGSAYVVGRTASPDFPTRRAFQRSLAGRACQDVARREDDRAAGEPCHDAFVAKLSPSGGALVYGTYLGGRNNEEGFGVAVDRRGTAYVTGNTDSADFPTRRARQPEFGSRDCPSHVPCPEDVFLTRLSANGRRLVYSTYVGGEKSDAAGGVAVDRDGAAYLTGVTRSSDFPVRRAPSSKPSGIKCGPPPGTRCPDVFVMKVRPNGRDIAYSRLLGGTEPETSGGIAVDRAGNAYVTGGTQSPDFRTVRPLQATIGNGSCSSEAPPKELCADAFVAKLTADGQRLAYSTFLGGNAEDQGLGIAVDRNGAAHVVGVTDSRAFRTLNPVQPAIGGGLDAYVAVLGPEGGLTSSTFLGGNDAERANGVAVDSQGRVHVAGRTRSPNFPTVAALQGLAGDYDMFITVLR
jgi:hypothetical protein